MGQEEIEGSVKIKEFVTGKMRQREVIPKNNEVNKFNFEGKIKSLKMRIVALIMLPCNIILDLRTDIRIVEWLYKYSETGSMRRELDDGLFKFC
ncbi:hypothetical protein RhiirA5_428729 [Rhizophagus irregularis]|uniref:Uncharacterized protein n=1 Tax=Rhizophagus irregularis TaxID=588596 RepID=A0A2I1EXY9_9GLOM|nr:hypothetical protein RhiirA5_428729 [Rhizophagus irregularis]GET51598.1 hypothetical protein GLOIN_2v1730032 [Rhizophagus irregularis DAOM 181602=DAOM 197198]PKY26997.1 hypothetical protein RhiirB3_442529 [Rhizophagus irregularis]UZO05039.1 hypothetical protein OCT59_025400 [Rhizophagus irregularis]UZO17245.1 hypothetical protein OCT59_008606 [Rhizophagus irregularis]